MTLFWSLIPIFQVLTLLVKLLIAYWTIFARFLPVFIMVASCSSENGMVSMSHFKTLFKRALSFLSIKYELDVDCLDPILHMEDDFSNWIKNEFTRLKMTQKLAFEDEFTFSPLPKTVVRRPQSFIDPALSVEEQLNSWVWDAQKSDSECLNVPYIKKMGFFERFKISHEKFDNFLSACKESYRTNPYHNWAHAVTVTHTLYLLFSNANISGNNVGFFSRFYCCAVSRSGSSGSQ